MRIYGVVLQSKLGEAPTSHKESTIASGAIERTEPSASDEQPVGGFEGWKVGPGSRTERADSKLHSFPSSRPWTQNFSMNL
jgi:hypothetical protein